ncbi:hypothetical protein [Butyrivibrio sp. XPD2002]|uniref:hypothetical protein n=1 Tax=Butyrivibrio sp. XPD2002 TaxID=1280665 RepID=UPI0004247CDA|nr:hypothetical protein [Butyrivibrio sp. XPD2002]
MRKYYVITSGSAIHESLLGIESGITDNVELYYPSFKITNSLLKAVFYVCFSNRFSWLFSWINKNAWFAYHVLEYIDFDDNYENIVVLAPGLKIDREINKEYLIKFKTERKCKFVLLLFDSLDFKSNGGWNSISDCFDIFDVVMTFDDNDAQKYGINHFSLPLDICANEGQRDIQTDLFFVGYNKKRSHLIENLYDRACMNGLKCDFNVIDRKKAVLSFFLKNKDIYKTRRICYRQVLKQIMQSNCILEVLCEGQKTSSLRYLEAVILNKKIITNNKNVKAMPLYNEEYVRYFEKIDDIDFDWIKTRENIDFNYQNEFSVRHLFDRLDRILDRN